MGDVDKALRRVSRKFPAELAKALYGANAAIVIGEWLETQLVGPDRRLDRALSLSVNGEQRLLHIEFQWLFEADTPYRVYEYNALLVMSFFDPKKPHERPKIDSRVVVLSGPQTLIPKEGTYQTSCVDQPFSGVQYRIEAVYQETVDDLLARDSVLWLAFAPLAADADEEKIKKVLTEAKKRTSDHYLYEEVAVAMSVLADADPRQRGLGKLIISLIPKEVLMQSWIYTEGEKAGKQAGKIAGKVEGVLGLIKAKKLKIIKAQQAQIEACTDEATLDSWMTRVLTASSVAEVLGTATPTKPAPAKKKAAKKH